VQAAVYLRAFTFAGGVTLAGCIVIEHGSTDAGVDQHGAFASVRFRCPVSLTVT
jgi:hypothetical protein